MDDTKKYFIHLLSTHLNNTQPKPRIDVDWKEIFRLAELHNVTAMITIEIKKLPIEFRPEKPIMSYFNQALGFTVQSYEYKISGINLLVEKFTDNKIRHLILKGAALRDLYPVGAVRTSGDADVFVDNLHIALPILENAGFKLEGQNDIQLTMFYKNEEYEIKNSIINEESGQYFQNLFDEEKSYTENGYTYYFKPLYHLAYVTSHYLRHIKIGGAGVRQLMDIDILLRCGSVDLDRYFKVCREMNIEKSAKVMVSLAKDFFDTPVDFDYKIDEQLYDLLTDIIINGGVFGLANANIGARHLTDELRDNKNYSLWTSVKTFFKLFFVNKNVLYSSYNYAYRHHILLPIAYFNRLFDAVFKRGKQNVRNIKSMFTDRDMAVKLNELANELELQ